MDAIERGVNHVKQKNKEYKGLKYMRIDGSTPARQREANVNTFQSDADCRVSRSAGVSPQAMQTCHNRTKVAGSVNVSG